MTTPGANLYLSWSPDSHYVAVANREDVVSIIDARSVGGGWRLVESCAWWPAVGLLHDGMQHVAHGP